MSISARNTRWTRRVFIRNAALGGAGMALSLRGLPAYGDPSDLDSADSLYGFSGPEPFSRGVTHSEQPAVAAGAGGALWAAWLGFVQTTRKYTGPHGGNRVEHGVLGNKIFCACRNKDGWGEPIEITPEFGCFTHPCIACAGDEVFVFWTKVSIDAPASIWMSKFSGGAWSAPVRISPEKGAHIKPAACSSPDGRVWLAWQGLMNENYDIFLAPVNDMPVAQPIRLTDNAGNDWDPALESDSTGRLWIAWSAFRDADYTLYAVSHKDGQTGEPIRMSDSEAYDLHPSLAIDGQDRLWIAWDRIRIEGHATSGPSKEWPDIEKIAFVRDHSGFRTLTNVEVRCVDNGQVLAPEAPIHEAMFPKGCYFSQSGNFPRIAIDASGTPVVAFRAYHDWSAWLGKYSGSYWFDVLVCAYAGDEWTPCARLENSDGHLDAPVMKTAGGKLWIICQTEYDFPEMMWGDHWNPPDDPAIPYHQSIPDSGCFADLWAIAMNSAVKANAPVLEPAASPRIAPTCLSRRLVPRDRGGYSIDYNGETYRLFWGDTHRHSSVARCSAGRPEPFKDDVWKFGHDVYQCDFMSMADHDVSSVPQKQWMWEDHRFADLYNNPGHMTSFFAFENGGWPVVFSIDREGASQGMNSLLSDPRPDKTMIIPHFHGQKLYWGREGYFDRRDLVRIVEIFQACRYSDEAEGAPRMNKNISVADANGWKRRDADGRLAREEPVFVQGGLAAGYRVGFIASTDHFCGACYACVFARSPSREDIFEGLYQRRCYGATAYGIVVDFRADGRLMGEEYNTDKPAELSVYARAYAPIRSVEILRHTPVGKPLLPPGEERDELESQVAEAEDELLALEAELALKKNVKAEYEQTQNLLAKMKSRLDRRVHWKTAAIFEPAKQDCRVEWREPEPAPGTFIYYARIVLDDEELAWASPVWVTYA